jgi:glycerol uptake facilitator-like aquaporin
LIQKIHLKQRLIAEFLGTSGLLIVVVGSGIMGETLSQGNLAIALLANSLATGAGLYALIQTFGHISGAHFNPAVSFVEVLWKRISAKDATYYAIAQVSGAVLGVLVAHLMYGESLLQVSQHDRSEMRFLISEVIATLGLISVIALSGKKDVKVTPAAVALYITAAYWCTSSTSFANPAATLARGLTNTFAGISPGGIPFYIAAQLVGALCAFALSKILRVDSIPLLTKPHCLEADFESTGVKR